MAFIRIFFVLYWITYKFWLFYLIFQKSPTASLLGHLRQFNIVNTNTFRIITCGTVHLSPSPVFITTDLCSGGMRNCPRIPYLLVIRSMYLHVNWPRIVEVFDYACKPRQFNWIQTKRKSSSVQATPEVRHASAHGSYLSGAILEFQLYT